MIVEVEVSDIKELKKAIESERKEIIISDKKLIWLIKTLKSVKNVAFVTFLSVSAGLITLAALPVAGPGVAFSTGTAIATAAGAGAAAGTGASVGLSGLGLAGIYKILDDYIDEISYSKTEFKN